MTISLVDVGQADEVAIQIDLRLDRRRVILQQPEAIGSPVAGRPRSLKPRGTAKGLERLANLIVGPVEELLESRLPL
jgi:hypothetical protein